MSRKESKNLVRGGSTLTHSQALAALAGGTLQERRQAVFLSRDERGANDELWRGVLQHFSSPFHPDESGAFGFWFCTVEESRGEG